MGSRYCHALPYPGHLFSQEFARIVVEDRRANPLDGHVTNPAGCFIHREIEVGEDHHQEVQLIEHGEPIVVEALLEGIVPDAVSRQGRMVQPQEVQLVGPAPVGGKSGDQEMNEVTRPTAAGTPLPVDDDDRPPAARGVKQQVVQVEISVQKRSRLLSEITLHAGDMLPQSGAEWHNPTR